MSLFNSWATAQGGQSAAISVAVRPQSGDERNVKHSKTALAPEWPRGLRRSIFRALASPSSGIGKWLHVMLVVLAVGVLNPAAAQTAPDNGASIPPPPGCPEGDCGLHSSSAYNGMVIGILQHVEDEDEMRKLYRWGKDTGVWRDFDDDLADFLARNRVLHVLVGRAQTPFILILSRAEYDGAPPLPGDLVRYVPLRAYHDAEGRKAPSRFSVLSGCVAMLCRKADGPCFKNYVEGFFNKSTGAQIDVLSGQPVPGGQKVDPMTMLPKQAAGK